MTSCKSLLLLRKQKDALNPLVIFAEHLLKVIHWLNTNLQLLREQFLPDSGMSPSLDASDSPCALSKVEGTPPAHPCSPELLGKVRTPPTGYRVLNVVAYVSLLSFLFAIFYLKICK